MKLSRHLSLAFIFVRDEKIADKIFVNFRVMSCNRDRYIYRVGDISPSSKIVYDLVFVIGRLSSSSSSRDDVVTNDNCDDAGRDNRKSATAGAKDGQFSGGFVTRESLHGGQ